MTRQKPHVPKPCHIPWSGMKGDERKRLCDTCDTHVHEISNLTQEEAQNLIDATPGICVKYASDHNGEALFRDSDDPQWRLNLQLKGAQRLIQAAALAIPMMFAGCQPQPPAVQPEVVTPLVVEDGKDVKVGKVGATSTPPPPEPIPEVQGMAEEQLPDSIIKPLVKPVVKPKTAKELEAIKALKAKTSRRDGIIMGKPAPSFPRRQGKVIRRKDRRNTPIMGKPVNIQNPKFKTLTRPPHTKE